MTTETGAGRPRYLPDRFPPRRDRFVGPAREGRVARPESLDPKVSPASRSTRDCWLDYYHDAVAEDLARRDSGTARRGRSPRRPGNSRQTGTPRPPGEAGPCPTTPGWWTR